MFGLICWKVSCKDLSSIVGNFQFQVRCTFPYSRSTKHNAISICGESLHGGPPLTHMGECGRDIV